MASHRTTSDHARRRGGRTAQALAAVTTLLAIALARMVSGLARTEGNHVASGGVALALVTGRVATGSRHTCALRTGDSLVCCGTDTFGRSAVPQRSFVQVSAGAQHTVPFAGMGTPAAGAATRKASRRCAWLPACR
jgi:hypothetical protein